MHYVSTNKTLMKKQSVKKMAKFKMLSFCQKVFLWHQTSLYKCSMCPHFVYILYTNVQCVHILYTKYQDVSVIAVKRVEFPVYALSMHHQELQRAITLTEMAPSP